MTGIGLDNLINDKEYASVACAILAVSSTYDTTARRQFQVALAGHENGHSICTFLKSIPLPEICQVVLEHHRSMLGMFIAASISSTEPDLLDDLSQSLNPYLRIVVGTNPQTPVHALERLSRDEIDSVRYATLVNPSTPSEVIVAMQPWTPGSVMSEVALHAAKIGLA